MIVKVIHELRRKLWITGYKRMYYQTVYRKRGKIISTGKMLIMRMVLGRLS